MTLSVCDGREEEAKITTIAAPDKESGPINVYLKKQGLVDMDYDVIDSDSNEVWMLIDTVGGIFSSEMKYHIKHRLEDQEESTDLGTGVIRDSDTDFDYHITKAKSKVEWDSDADVFSEDSDGDRAFDDFDGDLKLKKKFTAKWKFSKEIRIFEDKEMENQIGRCKVKCKGKYKRKTKKEIDFFMVEDHDEEGNVIGEHQEEKVRYEIKHKNKPKQFCYKCNLFGEDYAIDVDTSGASFCRAKLLWTCTKSDGTKMFEIHGDGRNARVQTFGSQNVIAAILLSFAVGCQFDPEDVTKQADSRCHSIADPNGTMW